MKNKIIVIVAIIIIVIIFMLQPRRLPANLVNPSRENSTQQISPTTTPTPTLQQFQFDSVTDLNSELETINPQILDSDFE